jgi:uncharacterized protein YciI
MLYLIVLDYLRPLADIDRHMAEHRAFLARHYEAGHFLLSGRKQPRTGGLILAAADDIEQVSRWICDDPFHAAGVAAYTVVGWQPTMAADGHWRDALVQAPQRIAQGGAAHAC